MTSAEGAATFRTSADAYDRHVGRYGAALAAGLIRVAGVQAGQRVLDVGCGPAALTCALAGVVGAENVTAIDPSEPFVEACRERVPGRGPPRRCPTATTSSTPRCRSSWSTS